MKMEEKTEKWVKKKKKSGISVYTVEWNEWLDHSLSIRMEHRNAAEFILQREGLLMMEAESRQFHLNDGFFIYLKHVCAGFSVIGNCQI